MTTYYFKIDSGYGIHYVGIINESEAFKTLSGAIDAEADLKRLLEHGHERVSWTSPRKPKGCEWFTNFRGSSWAVSGIKREKFI